MGNYKLYPSRSRKRTKRAKTMAKVLKEKKARNTNAHLLSEQPAPTTNTNNLCPSTQTRESASTSLTDLSEQPTSTIRTSTHNLCPYTQTRESASSSLTDFSEQPTPTTTTSTNNLCPSTQTRESVSSSLKDFSEQPTPLSKTSTNNFCPSTSTPTKESASSPLKDLDLVWSNLETSNDDVAPLELHEFSFIEKEEYENITQHKLAIEIENCPEEKNVLPGNRVVDLNYVLKWAIKLQYNHSKICTAGMLSIKDEIRWGNGLVSQIVFKCSECPKEYKYYTEDPNKKSKINYGAVWGTLAVGSTYGHLEEFLSVMDIPIMSQYMFMNIEKDIGEIWKDSLAKEMETTGVTEREHAISIGDVDEDGTPFVTVYLDGGWSKRSYGHSYNAASGVAVIIGKFTGKLLFLGVRNKYCSICARAANKRSSPGPHVCYRNWTSSSSAMEADIVVEGFKKSLEMHGIRYKKFIADGDSSVYAKIREHVDYGLSVEKVECTNHALKNYGKSLRAIKNDTTINIKARNLLTGNIIDKLEKYAQQCIYLNCGGNIENLKEDLGNGPQHVYGLHAKCKEIYCKDAGNIETNKFQDVIGTGLILHITAALDNLQKKAYKLIDNETNNRAETFMAILARFNAGKRLNLIQRGSFERRSVVSGLRYNNSYNWHHDPWKSTLGESPGQHFKKYMANHLKVKEQNYKLKNSVSNDHTHPKKKVRRELLPDIHYGPKAIQPKLSDKETESEAKRILNSLQISTTDQKLIASKTAQQFACDIYKTYKEKRLTASNFGVVIKRLDHTSCHALVKTILYGSAVSTPAMEYGKTMESVARYRFEEEYNIKIDKCGLFIDLEHGFLGASPDGLIGETGLVEIKCLYKVAKSNKTLEEFVREDKSLCLEFRNNEIKLKRRHNYFYQIQGQLHICNRDYCYFIVYVGQQKPLFVEKIAKEDIWHTDMLPKLKRFYLECILPEIIHKNIPKGLKCPDPQYIIDAKYDNGDVPLHDKFYCNKCWRSYKYRKNLLSHRRFECGKEKSFGCEYCDYRSNLKSNLIKHVQRMHKIYKTSIRE